RLVAEAVPAARRLQVTTLPEPFADYRKRAGGMPAQRQATDELSTTLCLWHLAQCLQQLGIVGGIALAIGIACRVDAWCAAEGIDGQPGVVGECRQAAQARSMTRLEDGVLDKRQAGFLRLLAGKLADRAQPYMFAEHVLQFLELAGVVAGQYQFVELHRDQSAKTSWVKVSVCAGPPLPCTCSSKTSCSRLSMVNCAK